MSREDPYKKFLGRTVRIMKQEGAKITTRIGKLTYVDEKQIELTGEKEGDIRIIDRSIIKELQLLKDNI